MLGAILFLITVLILTLILILPLIHLLIMQFSSREYLIFSLTLGIGVLAIVTIIRWAVIHFGI